MRGGDHDAGPESRAVLANAPGLLFPSAGRRRQPQFLFRLSVLAIFRREEEGKMLANNFVAAVALYFLGAFVPTADGSLGIQHEDGVILYFLHQQTKTLFAQPLRLFSRLAFGNVADGGGNQQTIGVI